SSGRTVVALGGGGDAGAAVGVGGLGGTAGDSAPVHPPSHAARANAPTVARVAIPRGLIGASPSAPAGGGGEGAGGGAAPAGGAAAVGGAPGLAAAGAPSGLNV